MSEPLKPLFRWAGGKRWLASYLASIIPKTQGRYYEPFCGAAAIFFALRPTNACLSDINQDLIEFYSVIKQDPEAILHYLVKWEADVDTYNSLRTLRPSGRAEAAARFYYLMKHSFNGIHRVNKKGQFNVPFGHRTHVMHSDPKPLVHASAALKNVDLKVCDFAMAVQHAREGDVIYFDPPYTVSHSSNGFVSYNAKLFGWSDQIKLADLSRSLVERGCMVVISNATHQSISELYLDFEHRLLDRYSVIGAKADYRRSVQESLFLGGFKCI